LLHVWLPMAMEGPTPVSALIHAATMVTAGVYLLMRSSPLIEYSSTVLLLCLWLGAITTVFSSLIGLFQQDIKKVIAYSTMSQLAQEVINNIRYQTICVGVILTIINSQITKAHNYLYNNYINISFFNSFSSGFFFKRKKTKKNPLYILFFGQYCYSLISIKSEKWKVNIFCKLVGISEAIRLILINVFFYLSHTTSNLFRFMLFLLTLKHNFKLLHNCANFAFPGLNTERDVTDSDKTRNACNLAFNEWLAGVIDGDGYFNLSKKAIARFTVVMDTRDKQVLYEIKHKFGGSIYTIANANALRYQLTGKKGLITLINAVNGLVRNPTRMLQMNKLCVKYEIELLYPKPLTYNNGWFSGFMDSDGSIYLNQTSGQIFISAAQKNKYLLEPLIQLYSGRVDIASPKTEAFKYIIYRKQEVFNMVDNYFSKYPLKSKKQKRINMIKEFFVKRPSSNCDNIQKLHQWVLFKERWDKYID